MKSCITFLMFLFAISGAEAQNIVPNSNFALHDTCPDNHSQFYRSSNWHSLAGTTPDYFQTCSTYPATLIPGNFGGYQPSSSGAYMGLYTYDEYGPWHEYIATDIPAMVVGSTYKVSIKISLAEGHSRFATEAPDVFFYKNAIPESATGNLILRPQVSFASYGIIRDTNWVVLSGTFTADSAYTHLGIGNFKTNEATDTAFVGYGNGIVAYYYIDSVAVERLHSQEAPAVPTNTEAMLCPNPVTGNAILSFANSDGQSHNLYIFDVSGRLVKKEEDITADSITIDGKALGTGVYHYKIVSRGSSAVWGRMLVE